MMELECAQLVLYSKGSMLTIRHFHLIECCLCMVLLKKFHLPARRTTVGNVQTSLKQLVHFRRKMIQDQQPYLQLISSHTGWVMSGDDNDTNDDDADHSVTTVTSVVVILKSMVSVMMTMLMIRMSTDDNDKSCGDDDDDDDDTNNYNWINNNQSYKV